MFWKLLAYSACSLSWFSSCIEKLLMALCTSHTETTTVGSQLFCNANGIQYRLRTVWNDKFLFRPFHRLSLVIDG